MDLATLNLTPSADAGAQMTVMHPVTDEPLLTTDGDEVTIQLVGSDSTVMRDEMKRRATKFLNKKQSRKRIDVDESIRESAETLAACTTGWFGISENGALVPFTRENVVRIFMKYDWLRQQVDNFVSERGNFFKA